MKRRNFIKSAVIGTPLVRQTRLFSIGKNKISTQRLKLSLNTYSFNTELNNGSITLFELIDFCKSNGLDAIDPTGYYFPQYPTPPSDSYIYEFKRKVFLAGLEISGTGIRNDFANADAQKRKEDLELIEDWCSVASKLGSPLLRVFAGKEITDNRNKQNVMQQVISEIKKACEIASRYGVMLALQNHNEFLKSSEEIKQIMDEVNSEWFGLHLDIGSLASRNAYDEIQSLIKYAITWQIKEEVWENGVKVPVDYSKLMHIISQSDYNGYLPLETLNTNPMENIPLMVDEIKKRL